ncbi:Fic family protein [Levilactobacillus namurensis]|uniref:Fic family protein n=1 Tax=Levilactobacillus namurensis TaxID=380393 RepID=UPI000465D828|nr:Fic family protein [Levilactobacillus namurensis]
MDFPAKCNLTQDQNRRFARQNLTRLVYTNARFEGITTTLSQTQAIMNGVDVTGVSLDDINTIVDLKRGWHFMTATNAPLSIDLEKRINAIVADKDSLAPGEFRTGQGGVAIGDDKYFTPEDVDSTKEQIYLETLLASPRSTTDKAITLMYHNMRGQLFWDGNKRSATLIANKLMIDGGAGLINVPLTLWEPWHKLISEFYRTGDMQALKQWTYHYGIQGTSL